MTAAELADLWNQIGDAATACPVCGRESCEDHLPADPEPGITDTELEDAVDVSRHGRAIDATGVPYVLDGIIPAYGMLGFIVAFSKVGKTTFGQALSASVAMGQPFLERTTTATRVLVLAAEDPPNTRPGSRAISRLTPV